MPLTPGTELGPYEIIALLGAGGMGEVYRANDSRLGRSVAINVSPQHLSSNPDLRARFEREARTVSSLNHPHICTLFDVGREGGSDDLAMELVEGETLAQRLARGAPPAADVLRLGVQLADALDRAHRAGVVHRGPCLTCRATSRACRETSGCGRLRGWPEVPVQPAAARGIGVTTDRGLQLNGTAEEVTGRGG